MFLFFLLYECFHWSKVLRLYLKWNGTFSIGTLPVVFQLFKESNLGSDVINFSWISATLRAAVTWNATSLAMAESKRSTWLSTTKGAQEALASSHSMLLRYLSFEQINRDMILFKGWFRMQERPDRPWLIVNFKAVESGWITLSVKGHTGEHRVTVLVRTLLCVFESI
jgi:hypothetical protein